MTYKVKGWGEFQHYKERAPTWLKLHKKLLDDYEFQSLPVASRALAPMIWLLASEHRDISSGLIDSDHRKIAFRLRMTIEEVDEAIIPLIKQGFIEFIRDDSAALSEGYSVDSPETEEETYRKETEREKESSSKNIDLKLFEKFWEVFPRQRRGDRNKAITAWKNAIKRTKATEEEIYEGACRYAEHDKRNPGFAKGTSAWLNDSRWTDKPIAINSFSAANGKPAYGDSIARAAATVLDNIRREEDIRPEDVH